MSQSPTSCLLSTSFPSPVSHFVFDSSAHVSRPLSPISRLIFPPPVPDHRNPSPFPSPSPSPFSRLSVSCLLRVSLRSPQQFRTGEEWTSRACPWHRITAIDRHGKEYRPRLEWTPSFASAAQASFCVISLRVCRLALFAGET